MSNAELQNLQALLREIEVWFEREDRAELTLDPAARLLSDAFVSELLVQVRQAGYLAHRTGANVSVIKASRVPRRVRLRLARS